MTGDVILFFELLDILAKDKWNKNSDGWHYISWAFLKPGNGSSVSHINQRIHLQFYKYKNKKWLTNGFTSIFKEWENRNKVK